jgi:hypothetical protein
MSWIEEMNCKCGNKMEDLYSDWLDRDIGIFWCRTCGTAVLAYGDTAHGVKVEPDWFVPNKDEVKHGLD